MPICTELLRTLYKPQDKGHTLLCQAMKNTVIIQK